MRHMLRSSAPRRSRKTSRRGISSVIGAAILILMFIAFTAFVMISVQYIEKMTNISISAINQRLEASQMTRCLQGVLRVNETQIVINVSNTCPRVATLTNLLVVFNDSSYLYQDRYNGSTDIVVAIKYPGENTFRTSQRLKLPLALCPGCIAQIAIPREPRGREPITTSITTVVQGVTVTRIIEPHIAGADKDWLWEGEKLFVNPAFRYVGIGTSNPRAVLHVNGSVILENLPMGSGSYVLMVGPGGELYRASPSLAGQDLDWLWNGAKMYANPNAIAIGIGTVEPEAPLHVVATKVVGYRVRVENPNDFALENYSVRIDVSKLPYTYFKIVDSSSGEELFYCFEQPNGECNETRTDTIWVRIPELPPRATVYLDIVEVSENRAVNGSKVFEFYEDFNTPKTFESVGVGNVYYEFVDGAIHIVENNRRDLNGFDSAIKVGDFDLSSYAQGSLVVELRMKVDMSIIGELYAVIFRSTISAPYNAYKFFGTQDVDPDYGIYGADAMYSGSGDWEIVYAIIDDFSEGSMVALSIDHDRGVGANMYIDWIRIRRYVSQEPIALLEPVLEKDIDRVALKIEGIANITSLVLSGIARDDTLTKILAINDSGYVFWMDISAVRDRDWLWNGGYLYTTAERVGIGTSNPQYELDVVGDIRALGNVLTDYLWFTENGEPREFKLDYYPDTPIGNAIGVAYFNGTTWYGALFVNGNGYVFAPRYYITEEKHWTSPKWHLDYVPDNDRMTVNYDGGGASTELAYILPSGDVWIRGRIGTNGYPPDRGYPSGWWGGIHTWDVYAEGSVGVGSGGSLGVVITHSDNKGKIVLYAEGSERIRLDAETASIYIAGRLGTNGLDPNSGYPSGWTGGIHTFDIYAEGSVGIGTNGQLIAWLGGTWDGQGFLYLNNTNSGAWARVSRWTNRLEIASSDEIHLKIGGWGDSGTDILKIGAYGIDMLSHSIFSVDDIHISGGNDAVGAIYGPRDIAKIVFGSNEWINISGKLKVVPPGATLTSYPPGWGMGVWTWDVFAEGSIAVGTNGIPMVWLTLDRDPNNNVLGGKIIVKDASGRDRFAVDHAGTVYIGHDLKMARTVDGDYNWKRALVVDPSDVKRLVINFGPDFTSGVWINGPLYLDHISESSASYLLVYDPSTHSVGYRDLSTIRDNDWFWNGNYLYTNAEKIGIGTADPQYKLDVVGDIRALGKVYSDRFVVTENGGYEGFELDFFPNAGGGTIGDAVGFLIDGRGKLFINRAGYVYTPRLYITEEGYEDQPKWYLDYFPDNGRLSFIYAASNEEKLYVLPGGDVWVRGRIGTNGFSPNSGYPTGWGGGVHTWDVYAEGSIGIGRSGSLTVVISDDSDAQGYIKLSNLWSGEWGQISRWTNRLEIAASDAIGFAVGGIGNTKVWIGSRIDVYDYTVIHDDLDVYGDIWVNGYSIRGVNDIRISGGGDSIGVIFGPNGATQIVFDHSDLKIKVVGGFLTIDVVNGHGIYIQGLSENSNADKVLVIGSDGRVYYRYVSSFSDNDWYWYGNYLRPNDNANGIDMNSKDIVNVDEISGNNPTIYAHGGTIYLKSSGETYVHIWNPPKGGTQSYDAAFYCTNDDCWIIRVSSSIRYKTDVKPLTRYINTSKIYELEPVMFRDKVTNETGIGLIAEHVAKVLPILVTLDKEGRPDAVKYQLLPVLMLPELKKHEFSIRWLNRTVEQLMEEVEELKNAIEKGRDMLSIDEALGLRDRAREADSYDLYSISMELTLWKTLTLIALILASTAFVELYRYRKRVDSFPRIHL